MSSAPSLGQTAGQTSGPENFCLDCYFNSANPNNPHQIPEPKHGITPPPTTPDSHRTFERTWRVRYPGNTSATAWWNPGQDHLTLPALGGTNIAPVAGNALTVNLWELAQPTISNVFIQLSVFWNDGKKINYVNPSQSLFAGYAWTNASGTDLILLPVPTTDASGAMYVTTPLSAAGALAFNNNDSYPTQPNSSTLMWVCPVITLTFLSPLAFPNGATSLSVGMMVYATLTPATPPGAAAHPVFDDPKMEVIMGS